VDQAQFDTITTFLRGLNTSGNLGSADLDVLKNAILGVFSNTYTPGYIGKSQEQLMSDYAPNYFTADQNGDPILQDVVSDIAKGYDLWTIRQNLKKVLNADQNVSGDSALVEDYMSQADVYYREFNAYKKAEREDAQAKIENDPFKKVGLPGFEDRYDPKQIFTSEFAQTAQRFADKRKQAETKSALKNTSESGVKVNPDNPKYNPENYLNTSTIQGNVADAIRGDKQNATDKDFLQFIQAIDKSTKMVLENPSSAGVYYRNPGLNAKTLAADLKKRLSAGLVAGADPLKGGTGKERNRPFTAEEKSTIQQYITQLEAGTPARTKTTVATSRTPEGLRLNKNPTLTPAQMKQKGITASGLGPEAESYVVEQMARILAAKLEQEGRTPLKDELTARGLFAQAAAKPKTTKAANKNYTVKGSNVVKLGS
jgi:hypothetical protein